MSFDRSKNIHLLEYWMRVCIILGTAHKKQSERCATRRLIITVINITFSVFVLSFSIDEGIQVFVKQIFNNFVTPDFKAQLILSKIEIEATLVTIAATVVVITTMLQLYLRYEERHMDHKFSSIEYFNLSHKIDRIMKSSEISEDRVHGLSKQLTHHQAVQCLGKAMSYLVYKKQLICTSLDFQTVRILRLSC